MEMHIYFMGICGTAMGNAALLMREAGHRVSGSDTGIYPPMSTTLMEAGIEILEGYDAERLARQKPDLVVIGNAQSRGNPEVEWLLESHALSYCSLPALLSEHLLRERKNIVISGTHGKTTTTAMTAFLLRSSGLRSGWLVGGVPRDLPSGAHLGAISEPFVIEGDEYDSAFFDKRSKFIHYRPSILVINNIEFDHVDIFRDLAEVQRTFNHLLRIVPRNGWVLVNGDDDNIAPLLPVPWTRVLTVGTNAGSDLQIIDFKATAEGSSFSLAWKGGEPRTFSWELTGLYNARNATMALLASELAKGNEADPLAGAPLQALSTFKGVRRRQEVRVSTDKLLVIEDFGHHPTAIQATLEAMRLRYPEHRIAAAFEPRSNTAATNIFQYEFAEAMAEADIALMGPVHRADKIPENMRLNCEEVAAFVKERGRFGVACESNDEVLEALEALRQQIDKPLLVCFFSNGAFGGIISRFCETRFV